MAWCGAFRTARSAAWAPSKSRWACFAASRFFQVGISPRIRSAWRGKPGLPLRLLRRCLLHSCFLHVAWTLQRSYHELSWYSLSSLSSSSCSFSSSLSVSVMSRIQRSSTAPLCSHAPGSLAKPEDLDCPFRLVAGLSQRCPQCT